MRRFLCLAAVLTTACVGLSVPRIGEAADKTAKVKLEKGDRIVLIGNTFAERMGRFGNFETLLATRLPDLQLTLRCMGWSADTPTIQPRPLNFGDMHTHLTEQKADVILLCFGMNESFEGAIGLPKFLTELQSIIEAMQTHKYNGESGPRLAIISPIPHENMGGEMPDPAEHNAQLKAYTEGMRQVAEKNGIPFVDLFSTVQPLMTADGPKLTFNGIHLTAFGDWAVAQVLADELGITGEPLKIEVDTTTNIVTAKGAEIRGVTAADGNLSFQVTTERLAPPPAPDNGPTPKALASKQPTVVVKNLKAGKYALHVNGERVAAADHERWAAGLPVASGPLRAAAADLRELVNDKNQQFFFRWRAVNGEYIYGRRKEPFGVISFPPEMKKLDEMVHERDGKIHDQSDEKQSFTVEIVRTAE